ncbi:cytochrome P450 oxidoreductase [Diaporthe sp. PMI_573]|nr:cytochrome P450 oxidoreductase [Diaporthaceae sp. PMI_573]
MALRSVYTPSTPLIIKDSPFYSIVALTLLSLLPFALYRLFFHPLSAIPGPIHLRLTNIPLLWRSYHGKEATYLTSLFRRLDTPILRIGPNEVLIADGAALAPIYSSNGGFPKASCYRNFDIDGFPSLFSALDRAHRAPRARSVQPLFATASLRRGEDRVFAVAVGLVDRLRREKDAARERGGRVDVLDAARRAAVDTVTAYLFGVNYGGIGEAEKADEKLEAEGKLSASEFVNAFVAVGRFFFLPTWAFTALEQVAAYLFENEDTKASFDSVQIFVERLVDEADVEDETYQSRMLKAGLSKEEVAAQLKDLMFAGTDSSGMNLSTFCWQLAKNPRIYAKVKAEILQAKQNNADYDPSSLLYLRACLRETLRLSMANPTRLPRVVPPGGWVFNPAYYLPAGTLVSMQIHTMHHNPAVYTDAHRFSPERWFDSPPEQLEKMNRDYMPFSLGSRACIARNLAMMELNMACAAILENGVLDGATNVGDEIEILEWFNSKVRGERVEIEYKSV